jgi:hypothetical protein
MRKSHIVLASLFAFWLAFGPVATAIAQSSQAPCESMAMSMPADDCCGEGMDQASCLAACLSASPAMGAATLDFAPILSSPAALVKPVLRPASILAPPDIAPPKPSVS